MALPVVLVCLALVASIYIGFSRRVGNYVNVLTPFLVFEIPAFFVLEIVYLMIFGQSGSDFGYVYCFVTYTAMIGAVALGFLAVPPRPLSLLLATPAVRMPGVPWLVLLLGIGLYAPILIANADLILSPREIYTQTRTGFGVGFFLSSFAVYIAYILLMFSNVRPVPRALFCAICICILYLHGSKGQVLQFFLIVLYHWVFVRQVRFRAGRTFILGGLGAMVILALFYLTSSAASRADMVVTVSGYADYTRNSIRVIDDPDLELQGGRLTFEQSFYTLVPRAMFPEKPTDFGSFWLARRYFPDRFAANTGAPAFSIGVAFADFGIFSIFYLTLTSLLTGMVLRIITARLATRPDPGTFILLVVLLNIQLIPSGAPVPLTVYYLVAVVVKSLGGKAFPRQPAAANPAS